MILRQPKQLSVTDLSLIAMFVAFMSIGANITAWAPFLQIGGVPITLQTFFCFLSGALLGGRRGAIAMVVYVLIGLTGMPVFAGLKGGLSTLLSPTFGFILSFIFTAYITGKVIEYKQQPTMKRFIAASIIGLLFNYLIGTNYMYLSFAYFMDANQSITYVDAWLIMLAYLPIDLLTIFVAAMIAPRIYLIIHQSARMRLDTSA
ncbi:MULTISPECIES: biotin transporter BioY [Virgibacillus]|uniref:biotin transporter BioY n=1 Tax=Virgibacillus TaxID=84406 RepID=UPI000687A2DB|nr:MULTISPECIES: biotin transporter BioY [Virgibacillus]MYL41195.1 BioY family transporter [Virgibacillus massiliensis]